jgi:hypothetical protein
MKTFLALSFVLSVIALNENPPPSNARLRSHKESAVVEFQTPIKLMSAVLQGQYLFVHDERRMEAGEDCTYVYKIVANRPVKLIVSFHCVPVPRQPVGNFTVRTSLASSEPVLYELQEYQFAGSCEGHQVPSRAEARNETVDVFACCL